MLRPMATLLCALATAAQAQDVAPLRVAAPAPVQVAAPADTNIAPFYAAHPGTLLWLTNADTRTAAEKVATLLDQAPIDGLSDGPALAADVRRAMAGGTVADDQRISAAWVRYVQALAAPVAGFDYADPALYSPPRSASSILTLAAAAPSLASYVAAAASPNPLYAALRADAIAQGLQDDPRVRGSLDRLRLVKPSGRAILVDAANAQLMMLEDGQAVDTMKVIVGKPDFATPLLAGTIHYVTFNPYWHIPPDVAKRKVAPIVLKRGIGYLKAARYQTVAAFGGDDEQPVDPASIDWKAVADGSVEAHIRQLTGPNNMMGKMKFGFVNDYGIFLHDTPHKELFKKAQRNLSLGCVRVERPERLAQWLLGREPVPPSGDAEQNVLIDSGVPVYISYLTARPDGEKISFAPDVYKLDPTAPTAQASAAGLSSKR